MVSVADQVPVVVVIDLYVEIIVGDRVFEDVGDKRLQSEWGRFLDVDYDASV